MIGSPFERYAIKKDDLFIRVAGFTDDTVLTVAVANSILYDVFLAESIKSLLWNTIPYHMAGLSDAGCRHGKTSPTTVGAMVQR